MSAENASTFIRNCRVADTVFIGGKKVEVIRFVCAQDENGSSTINSFTEKTKWASILIIFSPPLTTRSHGAF